MLEPPLGCRAGRATLLRAGQTPLEPLLALATPGSRRPNESHTTSVGSRNESDDPGAWTEPRQAPVLSQWNKQPMSERRARMGAFACDRSHGDGDVVREGPLQRVVHLRERVVTVHEGQTTSGDDDLAPWPSQIPR